MGVPVRISAWLMLGLAVFQFIRKRRDFGNWARLLRTNGDIETLLSVVVATAGFHSVVPIQQGLDAYYGKAHVDQINYVILAEYLKEEPYKTDMRDIGYRPWLLRPVRLKEERIGQSIVTAEISEFSATNAKTGYAATYIFFLAALALCIYVLLRDLDTNPIPAGFGAFLATILPAITRLTLDGFLSQTAVLFLFAFFASLLGRQELGARSFTLHFSLGMAYIISAYTEMTPFAAISFLLGVVFVRRDSFRHKRLMIMSAILLVALANPLFIYNLIRFLSGQYFTASQGRYMDELVINPLSLAGLSEALFGALNPKWMVLLEFCGVLFVFLAICGFVGLKRSEKIVLGCILLPVVTVITLLACRVPTPVYPIAKLTFSFSPFLCVLVTYAASRSGPPQVHLLFGTARILLTVLFTALALFGSIKEYREVANNTELLASLRDPRFLDVCRRLENTRDKNVLLFESDRFLLAWLCYHARHSYAYCDANFIGDAVTVNQPFPFSLIPSLDTFDLFVSRNQVVDPKSDRANGLVLIDNPQGMDRENGKVMYWLGPPARFRILAPSAGSANLEIRLAPGPDAKTTPVYFTLRLGNADLSHGELYGQSTEIKRVEIPKGFSDFELA